MNGEYDFDQFAEDWGIDTSNFEKLEGLDDDELRDMARAYVNAADRYKLTQIVALCREIFFDWEVD